MSHGGSSVNSGHFIKFVGKFQVHQKITDRSHSVYTHLINGEILQGLAEQMVLEILIVVTTILKKVIFSISKLNVPTWNLLSPAGDLAYGIPRNWKIGLAVQAVWPTVPRTSPRPSTVRRAVVGSAPTMYTRGRNSSETLSMSWLGAH